MNFDLARLCRLAPMQPDLYDAVTVFRLDTLGVHVLPEADGTVKLAGEALLTVIRRLLVDPDLSFACNGEQTLLDGHIQLLRIDSGGKQIDLHVRGRPNDVDGRECATRQRPDSTRGRQWVSLQLVQVPLQAPEFVEQWILQIRKPTKHVSTSLLAG